VAGEREGVTHRSFSHSIDFTPYSGSIPNAKPSESPIHEIFDVDCGLNAAHGRVLHPEAKNVSCSRSILVFFSFNAAPLLSFAGFPSLTRSFWLVAA
jgi:hypothetical protein